MKGPPVSGGLFVWVSPGDQGPRDMLKPKQRGLASCPPDYLKHQISRLRLNTTAFPSRYLGRHTRRTATSRISTNCPSKTNIRRPRRSCVMPRGPKGNLAVLGQTLHFDVGQPLPILPQLRTCHCTVLTDVLCQRATSRALPDSPRTGVA